MGKQWAALTALLSFPCLSSPSLLLPFVSLPFSLFLPSLFASLPWHYLHITCVLHSSVDECCCQMQPPSAPHTHGLLLPPHPLLNGAVRRSFIHNGPL